MPLMKKIKEITIVIALTILLAGGPFVGALIRKSNREKMESEVQNLIDEAERTDTPLDSDDILEVIKSRRF